ncbi:MAG: hypothetical protein AAF267_06445 [Deinococcota bacterium]
MKKMVITGLAVLAMALSLAPRFSQPLAADTHSPVKYILADGDHDTDDG